MALHPSNIWAVKVSLDGTHFSPNSMDFKFIDLEQIERLSIHVGPEYGGTVITIDLFDLPPVDGVLIDVFCKFPGY